MTQNEPWHAPAGLGQAPDGSPFPEAGQPTGIRPGWAPPPRPGLVPLRPLDVGTILAAPYQLLRRNPRPTFGMSLLLQGSVLLLTLVVVSVAAFFSLSRIDFATGSEASDEIVAGSIGMILLSSLVPLALSLVATAVMQGIIVLEVARQSLGEKLRFRQLWALARGRILALVGYSLALTAVLLMAVAIVIGLVAGLSVLGSAGALAGVALALLLGAALVVLGAWISTKLAFVPSILMLERLSVRESVARSWRLSTGAFWKILGILLLVAVILNVVSSIAGAPLQFVAVLLPALVAPTGDETAIIALFVAVTVVSLVLTIVVSAVILVVQSATTALLYLDQRIRKEGLDLELARYVEARQFGGASELADPYAARMAAPAASPAAQRDASPWA
ncbi:glycerophosphoryl diester phosphodiesterase membrane domain-containing protein [Marisediminicola antarctica]|nr:glycerophosphoryl diester phosphodiesterase membrane domain-containing protein [Marisediminicola antarctica]